jgi:CRP-like cAMP-binding protein
MILHAAPLYLARKFAQRQPLAREDEDHLARVLARNVASFGPRVPLVEAGEAPGGIQIVLEGWACSWRVAPNGRRQITAIHLPGDVCDFNVFMMKAADCGIEAVDAVRVARLSRSGLNELTRAHPAITSGLWWESLSSASIQCEWLVSVGQRNARQRIAHLLCELFVRLRAVGLTEGHTAHLPLTQSDIGDACGMTPEHTNRTLRELRDSGLCLLHERRLEITDWRGLVDCAGFHPYYLHFDREIERHEGELASQGERAPEELALFAGLARPA